VGEPLRGAFRQGVGLGVAPPVRQLREAAVVGLEWVGLGRRTGTEDLGRQDQQVGEVSLFFFMGSLLPFLFVAQSIHSTPQAVGKDSCSNLCTSNHCIYTSREDRQ